MCTAYDRACIQAVTVRALVQAHAPLCDTLSALLLRARGDGESAPRAVLAMEHMEPMEPEPLDRPQGEAEGDGTRGRIDNRGQAEAAYPVPYPHCHL